MYKSVMRTLKQWSPIRLDRIIEKAHLKSKAKNLCALKVVGWWQKFCLLFLATLLYFFQTDCAFFAPCVLRPCKQSYANLLKESIKLKKAKKLNIDAEKEHSLAALTNQ